MSLITLIVGIVGMVFILIAFVLDEFYKRFNQDTLFYNFMNVFGSGLLIIYAISLNGWPFLILNGLWLTAASIKLYNILKNSKKKGKRKKRK